MNGFNASGSCYRKIVGRYRTVMINTNPLTRIEYFGVLARCKQTPQVESQRRVGCCVHRIRNDTILRPVYAIVPNGCIWLGTTTFETLWHHHHLHVLALCMDVQAKLPPLQKYSTAACIILTSTTSSTLCPLNVQATCTQHSMILSTFTVHWAFLLRTQEQSCSSSLLLPMPSPLPRQPSSNL